ncbi:MAG: autotransporter protein [Hyphomicrobiales bacterium]|nr:autotransporter protein [Hyphomicrobiales bacterium]
MPRSMSRQIALVLLGSSAMISLSTATALAGPGAVTLLENPPAPGFVRTRGISGDGSILVGVSILYSNSSSAASWSSTGALTLIPATGQFSSANAISADGFTIVGDHFVAGVGDSAFVLQGGNIYYLPVLTGIQGNGATAVNADGSIVVGYSEATFTTSHAVQWSGPNWSTLTDLGTLVPGGTASANGVSGDGTIVVGRGDGFDAKQHALYWQGGTAQDLGTTGLISAAWGISADGSTIVGTADGVGFTVSHPTSWTGPGFATQTDLGSLGGTTGTAWAVNADGSVIVGTSALAGNFFSHAFRYANGTMSDLNTLMLNAGVNMTGISLSEAMGISANGDYIAANDTFNGLAYLVYYSDGIGGLTNQAEQQASVDTLGKARQAAAIQNDAYAGILSGDLDRSNDGNQIGALGLVGSVVGGVRGHAEIGNGWSVSGGVADGTSSFGTADIGNGLMGSIALRYDANLAFGGFRPFAQVGGSFDLLSNVSLTRTYPGGSGTGITQGTLAALYGRAGLTKDFDSGDQLTFSGELGGRWLSTAAYSESLSASNPFPASVAAGTDTQLVSKLGVAWTHPLAKSVDLTVRAAVGTTIGGASELKVATLGFGTLTTGLDHPVWGELGAHLSWNVSDKSAIDLYATGVFGQGIGANAHVGAGYHYHF